MKLTNILKMVVLASPLLLASCRSHKQVTETKPVVISPEQTELLTRVDANNMHSSAFIGSKLKFTVSVGDQQLSLTGNLRIKRDDVIRLQLMAFGFVEAARIEFTQDYVLFIDRINKQYLKAPYYYIDFLRNSGINYNTLQALFCNELFQPGKKQLTNEDLQKFTTSSLGEGEAIINYEDGDGDKVKSKMFYSWLVYEETGRIKMANIMYRDPIQGNTQLNWEYRDFKTLGHKPFPTDMAITLTTPNKEVKLGVKLNYLNTDSDWETRTRVSDKYREVDFDEILRRFMAL